MFLGFGIYRLKENVICRSSELLSESDCRQNQELNMEIPNCKFERVIGTKLDNRDSKRMFKGRIGIQQRVLPAYRVPFFDGLASACLGDLQIFSGAPRPEEGIESAVFQLRQAEHIPAKNIYISKGKSLMFFQLGLIRWLLLWRPDVLIVDSNARGISTFLAVGLMRFWRKPVI